MPQTPPPGSTGQEAADPATQEFLAHRELLFSIVYNMLGAVADTEDVLQETWLAWASRVESAEESEAGPIDSPRAYLVRIAVNKALARRAVLNRLRETYIGPWLPEPLVSPLGGELAPGTAEDGAEVVERSESVSLALMVVLETLTPLERAVFVLHEVFGYAHGETARILGRSPAAVRQLAHRAREHVHARRPRFAADPETRRQVTEQFAAAVGGGDLEGLLRLLAPDVTLWADGGGKAPAAGRRPVHGREVIAKLLVAGRTRAPYDLQVRFQLVNGDPSALMYRGDTLFGVLVLELAPGTDRVAGIYFTSNPDKLTHLS